MLKGTPAALFQLDIFILGLHKSSSAWFTVKKKDNLSTRPSDESWSALNV